MSRENSRVGDLAVAEKYREAAAVADLIGGADGSVRRANANQLLGICLSRLGDKSEAARAACSSVRAARASGSRTALVAALNACGRLANQAPDEMAQAERESREQERLSGSLSYDLDLSREGRISLPTTPTALSRLGLAYHEAAVGICEAALASVGGRDSPAADDNQCVPQLSVEAQARGHLAVCLCTLGEERQRSLKLLRQAVALQRQLLRTSTPGVPALEAKQALAAQLSNLGLVLKAHGSDGMAESEACLREALELSEETGDVELKQTVLTNLTNLSCRPDQRVGQVEAAAFRSRLNALYAQTGRIPDTSCTICLEPLESLEQSGGGADSAVQVLNCGHQFHLGCLSTWWRTRLDERCPLCKEQGL